MIRRGSPNDGVAFEITANIVCITGGDAERSWIITTELNRLPWPAPDIRAFALR